MMTFGLHSAILQDLTFEEVVDYSAQVGFKSLEVCCWPVGKAIRRYAGITHIDINNADEEKLLYYKKYAEDKGLKIATLGYYPNPLDPDKEASDVAVKHIYKLIDASAAMGVNMITTFIGRDKNKTIEENYDIFEEVWTPIIKYAEEKKVKVAIENCPMLYTVNEWPGGNNMACNPHNWREMFKRIPSDYFGLCYDPSHPYLQRADFVKPVYDFADKIFHVHFKDIKIYPDKLYEYGAFAYPTLWHSPKIPGMGDIDFGALISALNDIHFEGSGVIEVEDKAFESNLDDIKKSVEQSYRYLRQFI